MWISGGSCSSGFFDTLQDMSIWSWIARWKKRRQYHLCSHPGVGFPKRLVKFRIDIIQYRDIWGEMCRSSRIRTTVARVGNRFCWRYQLTWRSCMELRTTPRTRLMMTYQHVVGFWGLDKGLLRLFRVVRAWQWCCGKGSLFRHERRHFPNHARRRQRESNFWAKRV